MQGRYNTRSPAVKRLMKEAQELSERTDQYFAQPLEDNLFEWHFTVRGPLDSDFQAGIYHGRIILPVDYPMKPPSIIWLTPNGRFETNKKICLSISGHHPESWQPSWSIRTALLAIIGFMPTHPGGAIGSLDYKPEERKALAKKSKDWKCPTCGDISEVLLDVSSEPSEASKEAKELAAQISFQGEKPKGKEECPIEKAASSSAPNTSTTATTPPTTTAAVSSSNNAQENPSNNEQERPLPQNFYPPFSPWGFPAGAMPSATTTPNLPSFQHPPSSWGSPPTSTNQDNRVASMVSRFPYPPSFYPGGYHVPFYPPGFALPPGVGMFPCPYPPGSSSRLSSTPERRLPVPVAPHINTVTSTTPASSRPRVSFPNPPVSQNIAGRQQEVASPPRQPPASPVKNDMMSELLSKVKRVGSDVKAPAETGSVQIAAEENVIAEKQELVAETLSDESEKSDLKREERDSFKEKTGAAEGTVTEETVEAVGDSSLVASVTDRKQDSVPGETDSEISQSLLKKDSVNGATGSNISHSEILNNGDDNSEAGVPPIEMSDTEQRSNFERSSTSSMSDLQKKRKQGGGNKGLRQRQSALAQVSTDFTEESQADPEQEANPTGRQRIEASSGDNSPPNRFNQEVTRTINEARRHHREVLARTRPRRYPYDASFIIMVGLSLATVIILLNRFLQIIDWSDIKNNYY